MALREYFQDLLATQTSSDGHGSSANIVTITVIDDNSSSCIPEENSLRSNFSSSMGVAMESGYYHNRMNSGDGGIDRDQEGFLNQSKIDLNRISLDGFRRRKRFLRETLSPVRHFEPCSPDIKYSPVLVASQATPSPKRNDITIGKDTQRNRIAHLRRSVRQQRRASPHLL